MLHEADLRALLQGRAGNLLQGLRERNIFNRVNLIIVSDHGMATQDWRKAVIMDEMFDVSLTERIFWASLNYQVSSLPSHNTTCDTLASPFHAPW